MTHPTGPARHGFTLIELLIVIAVIAVLIALLLPALGEAKHQAQVAACQGRQRGIGVAIHVYAGEHDGYVPVSHADPTRIGAEDGNGTPTGLRVLYTEGHETNPEAFYCPTTLSGWKSHANHASWALAADGSYPNKQTSYAYIAHREGFKYGSGGYLSPIHAAYHVRRSLDDGGRRVMLYDHNEVYGGQQAFKTNHIFVNGKGFSPDAPPRGFTFLFADGSVVWANNHRHDYRGVGTGWMGSIYFKSNKAIYTSE